MENVATMSPESWMIDEFTAIFNAYRTELTLYAISFTKNMELAEDLVQEAWIKILNRIKRAPETVRGGRINKTYVKRTIRSLFLSGEKKETYSESRKQ